MNSRDTILHRIRTNVGADAPLQRPPVPEVWPSTNPTAAAMAERFTQEIEAVSGQVVRCATVEEAKQRLGQLLDELECTTVGAVDRPLCRELAGERSDRVVWPGEGDTAKSMAEFSAGLVEADYLLADTGTCMIACGTSQQRVLCYLPPTCIVLAKCDRLAENMPAAWKEIAARVADPSLRGEFVFVTGPSRTADIEKILILGVHGPKRVVVLLIG